MVKAAEVKGLVGEVKITEVKFLFAIQSDSAVSLNALTEYKTNIYLDERLTGLNFIRLIQIFFWLGVNAKRKSGLFFYSVSAGCCIYEHCACADTYVNHILLQRRGQRCLASCVLCVTMITGRFL